MGKTTEQPAQGEGTAPSFDELFTRYSGPIYRYLLGMVGDVEQAQDLTQETFLKVYRALPRTPHLVLPAWLYRIATTTALDALRRRRRLIWLPFLASNVERCPTRAPNLPTPWAEREAVDAALAQLSSHERACLLLRARNGLALAEIAVALGVSEAHAQALLLGAKERFRRIYGDREPRAQRQ